MLIPITLPAPGASATTHPKLPTALARIAHDELVLIELQGALDVELTHLRERDGRFVGTLSIDDAAVRTISPRPSTSSRFPYCTARGHVYTHARTYAR